MMKMSENLFANPRFWVHLGKEIAGRVDNRLIIQCRISDSQQCVPQIVQQGSGQKLRVVVNFGCNCEDSFLPAQIL
jgi:hypothetical protein